VGDVRLNNLSSFDKDSLGVMIATIATVWAIAFAAYNFIYN